MINIGDTVEITVDETCGFPQGHIGIVTEIDNGYTDHSPDYQIDHKYYYNEHEIERKPFRGFTALTDTAVLPTRATRFSAGYDFTTPKDIRLHVGFSIVIPTGISSYMMDDEVLLMHIRSSLGINHGIILSNATSVIDSDYDGEIMIGLRNLGDASVSIAKGSRIAQGIFQKYLIMDDDNVTTERQGGIGSSGQ